MFIIGTAGSGKSRLTSSFSNWLKLKKQEVISVNLDPGALSLPYQPDVDVREYISLNGLMENYSLGPNGALIMAADLIATEVDTIRTEIEDYNADYVIIDTPGQMELFAFRVSGPYIVNELTTDPKALLYLFDSTFSINPLNYVSNLFLASAVHTRFTIPMLHVLSKTDLVPEDKLEAILDWGEKPTSLEDAIEETLTGTSRLMSRELMHLIANLDFLFSLIPVSATSETGFINLHATVMRIFTGGEEII
ncbi:MAG: ATP/GTP-binding protein [Candidatus Bathyarchaeota archaeon]|nr:MAG: ATP/GTP-binding protein [Candidatus Bathyarchaeota archaeon]